MEPDVIIPPTGIYRFWRPTLFVNLSCDIEVSDAWK